MIAALQKLKEERRLRGLEQLRAEKGHRSLESFARTYLHSYLTCPPSKFHVELIPELSDFHKTRGRRLARIAPRGSAKSFWVSQAMPLRSAVCGYEPYTLLLSEAGDQVEQLLSPIREELQSNEELLDAFPDAELIEAKANRLTLRNGCTIHAMGTGQKIRGRRRRAARPSLVIVDDPQSNKDIHSPTERSRAWEWFTREVLKAGSPETNFVVVGTALHREAIAVKAQTLPNWDGRTYKSILRWPERLDLWNQWERLLCNMAEPSRSDVAAAFYSANRNLMDAGSEVLWPDRWPIDKLMASRAEIGPAAFDSEEQGNPGSGGLNDWPPEYFDRPGFWFDDWPRIIKLKVAFYDPAGHPKKKPGDYHSLTLLAIDGEGDEWYENFLWHGTEVESADYAVKEALAFNVHSFGVESNFGGIHLVNVMNEAAKRQSKPLASIHGVLQVERKNTRIRAALSSPLHRGSVHLRRGRGGMLTHAQALDFPNGDHDDGLDSMAGARELAAHLFR